MANQEQKNKAQTDTQTLIEQAVLGTPGVSRLVEKQPIARGVLLTSLFGNTDIEIYVNVIYGSNIPEVSWNIQERVKEALSPDNAPEDLHINIHIEGVDFVNAS